MTTNVAALEQPNQRKLDRCQNGNLVVVYLDGSNNGVIKVSADAGQTWASAAPNINGWGSGSIFVDLDDYIHIVWRQNGATDGRTDAFGYYMRGTPNATRTAWTWSTALSFGGHAAWNQYDLVAFREPDATLGWRVHVVASDVPGSSAATIITARIDITAAGAITLGAGFATNSANYGHNIHLTPSIDFHNTGDGKTVKDGTPHLYIGWSSAVAGTGLRFKKATYSAGAWTWGAERGIDNNIYNDNGVTGRWLQCVFDGTRFVMGGQLRDSANQVLALYYRDAADTGSYIMHKSTSGELQNGSLTYDPAGNIYLFGWNNPNNQLAFRKWNRVTGALDTTLELEPSAGRPYASAKRGATGNQIEWVYLQGNQNPYSLQYARMPIGAPDAIVPTNVRALDTSNNTPTLAATVTDLFGRTVRAEFQVATDSAFTQGLKTFVGSRVSRTGVSDVIAVVAANTAQFVRARLSYEDGNYSAYSAGVAFTSGPTTGARLFTRAGSFQAEDGPAGYRKVFAGLGFRPRVVLMWTSGSDKVSNTWSNGYHSSFGFTDCTGITAANAASKSRAIAGSAQNGVSPANTARQSAAAGISVIDVGATNTLFRASVVDTTDDSFTIEYATLNTIPGIGISWMAIGSDDPASMELAVLDWDSSGAVAPVNQTVTGLTFQPDLLIHLNAVMGAASALPQTSATAHMSVGFANHFGQEWSFGINDSDALAAGEASRLAQVDASMVSTHGAQLLLQQWHHVAMTGTGFTVRHSSTSGRRIYTLAIRGITSKIGSYLKSATTGAHTETIERTGFRPRAALFSGVSAGPLGGIPTQSHLHIGGSDGVNNTGQMQYGIQGANPTQAYSWWAAEGAAWSSWGDPNVLYVHAGAQFTDNAVNLVMSSARAERVEVGYLILGDPPRRASLPALVRAEWAGDGIMNGNGRSMIDRSPDGTLWAGIVQSAILYQYYSKDEGRTWESSTAGNAVHNDVHVDGSSYFIDADGYHHFVYRASANTGVIRYFRGIPNATNTGIATWQAGSAGTAYGSAVIVEDTNVKHTTDVVAFRDGVGISTFIAYGLQNAAPNAQAVVYRTRWGLAQTAATDQPSFISSITPSGSLNVNIPPNPSIEFRHTGDGKIPHPDGADIYVVWSTGDFGVNRGVRLSRSLASGGWSSYPDNFTVSNDFRADSGGANDLSLNIRYQPASDGNKGDRLLIGGWWYAGGTLGANHTACLFHCNIDGTAMSAIIQSATSGTGRQAHNAGVVTFPNGDAGLLSWGDSPPGLFLWRVPRGVAFDLNVHRVFVQGLTGGGIPPRLNVMRGHQKRGGPAWTYVLGNQNPYDVMYDDIDVGATGPKTRMIV